MIVTAIERIPKRRGRVQIYLDGVAALDLPSAVVRSEGLAPGRSLDSGDVDAMLAKEHRREAMATAAAMLARRPHSEREIRRRLAQRKTDPPVIDETLARLRELRLIDDAEFARIWTESRDRTSPRGRRLIVQELRTAGVESTIAVEAAADVDDGDAAYRLASTRTRSLASLEHDAFRARLGGFLQRRGFGWDVARKTVDRCWSELGGEQGDGFDDHA